jgi:hypothetical protein
MSTRGGDPYEEAKRRASIEEFDAKKKSPPTVGPAFPFTGANNRGTVTQDIKKYYAPQNFVYYGDEEEDDEEGGPDKSPAELTDIPTSTTNVRRPRTVAAGYELRKHPNGEEYGVLTVVFRDGTVWNYDGVSPGQWQNFQASISKGKPWINEFKFGVGYAADLSQLPPGVQEAVYNAARTAQLKYQSKRTYRGPEGRVNRKQLGKTGTKAAQRELRRRTPKKGGSNPSRGGKNPF